MSKFLKSLNGRKTVTGVISGIALVAFMEARGIVVETIADAATWEQVVVGILGLVSGTMLPTGLFHKWIKERESSVIIDSLNDKCEMLAEAIQEIVKSTGTSTSSNVANLIKDLTAHEIEAEARRAARRIEVDNDAINEEAEA